MIKITKIMDIQKNYDLNDETICRIHSSLLRGTNLNRNDWIKIVNIKNNRFILRRIKGGSSKGSSKEYIELDYDSRLELNIKESKNELGLIEAEIKIEKAGIKDVFFANWYYPNYAIKISFRLAILSFVMGIIGLLK